MGLPGIAGLMIVPKHKLVVRMGCGGDCSLRLDVSHFLPVLTAGNHAPNTRAMASIGGAKKQPPPVGVTRSRLMVSL
jgi:hypothetical protein